MSKTMLQRFDEDFLRELRGARRNPDAFERATEKWESQFGFTPFESYDSFRRKKEWNRKRKK